MIKFFARLILTVGVGFSCYCFTNPAFPHRLLTQYVQANSPTDSEIVGQPRQDVVLAKAAIKFLEEQHGVNGSADPRGISPQSKIDIAEAFFSEEDPYSNPTVFSEAQRPTREQSDGLRYAPIETGPVVQSNPYLQ
jgi:hypothetical protein